MSTIIETNYFGNFKQEENPKVLIIPTPYEYTTSYNKGTKNGPQAILNASSHLEHFDEELWTDISKIGINTSSFVNCEFVNNKSKNPFNELEEVVRNTIIGGSAPIVIGGESSISYGSIKAVYDLFPDISILYFSACPNLRESYQNNRFSHLSPLRQIIKAMPDLKIVLLGVSSMSKEEVGWLEADNPNIEIFFAKDKNQWKVSDIISNLTKNVYISFNFNTLDSGIMPSCVIPEPSGLSWDQTTDIIRNICAFKEVLGMDFVELSPISGLHAPDFLASRLIYKTIGYVFARQLGVFEESDSSLVTSGL